MQIHVPVFECSFCNVPAVLRYSLKLSGGSELLYTRDCKHRTGELVPRVARKGEHSIEFHHAGEPVACATVPFTVPDAALEPA